MPSDWDTLDVPDEAAYDSFAAARVLSRLGDNRYGTFVDTLDDPGTELWDADEAQPCLTSPGSSPAHTRSRHHQASTATASSGTAPATTTATGT
jgi:hypothetical protein